MKNNLLAISILITFIFFQNICFSQETHLPNNNINFKNIKGDIWVRDSIYYYEGDDTEWILDKKYKVTTRDNKGRVATALQTELLMDDFWINSELITVNYYDNNTLKDSLVLEWDILKNVWRDTIFYIKNDPNGYLLEKSNRRWSFSNANKKIVQDKYLYQYSNNYSKVTQLYKINIQNNGWKNIDKKIKKHNQNGQLIDYIYHQFTYKDNFNFNKTNFFHAQYFYENDSIKEKIIRTKAHDNDQWINEIRHLYKYNNTNQLTDKQWEIWNDENKKWEIEIAGKYQYENNNLITEIWKGGKKYNFVPVYRKLYKYNNNNKVIHELKQNWNKNDSTWHDYYENTNKYNSDNKIILHEYIKETKKIRKLIFEYYENKKLKSFTFFAKDLYNNWIEATKETYSYLNEKIKEFSYFRWDEIKNKWYIAKKLNYTYDENENLILETNRYIYNGDSIYRNNTKKQYFWSQFNTTNKINSTQNYDIFITPNPASDFLYIYDNEIKDNQIIYIFDLFGNLVKTNKIKLNSKIDISYLKPGIYILKTKNFIQGIKFIVK